MTARRIAKLGIFSRTRKSFLSPASVEAPSFRLAGAKVGGSFYFARGWREVFFAGRRKGVCERGLGVVLICVKENMALGGRYWVFWG